MAGTETTWEIFNKYGDSVIKSLTLGEAVRIEESGTRIEVALDERQRRIAAEWATAGIGD
jgi:hypothetical protein